ncbi:hypothetical protein ACT80S_18460 [Ramlibacter sp. MAHUQ-53]|uniref:hypothetical protein n=1 Tax=unclassified Ramlibacter TaxID=2617605 RepID=UPI003627AFEE
MTWLQVLTQEPVSIPKPQKQKAKQYGERPTSFRLPPEQREWVKKNGGAAWLREQIRKAMEGMQ